MAKSFATEMAQRVTRRRGAAHRRAGRAGRPSGRPAVPRGAGAPDLRGDHGDPAAHHRGRAAEIVTGGHSPFQWYDARPLGRPGWFRGPPRQALLPDRAAPVPVHHGVPHAPPPPRGRLFSRLRTLLLVACDLARAHQSDCRPSSPPANAPSPLTFRRPRPAAAGAKPADAARTSGLGVDRNRLSSLGQYLMSQPYENYAVNVHRLQGVEQGRDRGQGRLDRGRVLQPVRRGSRALLRLHPTARPSPCCSRGTWRRPIPRSASGPGASCTTAAGFPRDSHSPTPGRPAITLDQVFRHTSGIIPEAEHQIASPEPCRASPTGASRRSPSGRTPTGRRVAWLHYSPRAAFRLR